MELDKVSNENEKEKVEISKYKSYRTFIRDWFRLKKARRNFSFRQFSKLLGLSSPNYMQLVMNGERTLSLTLAKKVASVMKLSNPESEYFTTLVELEQSTDLAKKRTIEKKLASSLRVLRTSWLSEAQKEIVEGWQHMLIRELVFFPDFQMDINWMQDKVDALISIEEIERSVELLIKAGHWFQDENLNWKARDVVLDTGDTILTRELVNKYHVSTFGKWSEILPDVSVDMREIGIVQIPISQKKIPDLKLRIRAFQDEIIGWLQSETDADTLVQLGTYLMPFKK